MQTLAQKAVEEMLTDIADAITTIQTNGGRAINGIASLRPAALIFSAALMDRMWELQEREDMAMKDREAMATALGDDLRRLVKTYTDIDTWEI